MHIDLFIFVDLFIYLFINLLIYSCIYLSIKLFTSCMLHYLCTPATDLPIHDVIYDADPLIAISLVRAPKYYLYQEKKKRKQKTN